MIHPDERRPTPSDAKDFFLEQVRPKLPPPVAMASQFGKAPEATGLTVADHILLTLNVQTAILRNL